MIKYECDNCHEVVVASEMVSRDQPFAYSGHDPQLVAFVSVMGNQPEQEHFCKACMWKVLGEMMDKMAPTAWTMEVENEPTPERGERTVTDTLLHELHAEGHLPESGPHEHTHDESQDHRGEGYRNNPNDDGDVF